MQIEFDGTDWKAALLSMDIPLDVLDNALAYWKDMLEKLSKTKKTPAKKDAPEQIARKIVDAMPEGNEKDNALGCILEAEVNGQWDFIIQQWGAK